MWIAIINNLPELILGTCWTAAVFLGGTKFQQWKSRRKAR